MRRAPSASSRSCSAAKADPRIAPLDRAHNRGTSLQAAIAEHPLPDSCYRFVLISATSNNPGCKDVRADLQAIRRRICAARAIWIVPPGLLADSYVRQDADNFYAFQSFEPARNGVHPQSYRQLWSSLEPLLR